MTGFAGTLESVHRTVNQVRPAFKTAVTIQDTRYKNFIHQFWAQQGHTKMMHMKEEKSK